MYLQKPDHDFFYFIFPSMDGGELFSRIQDRGDQAFTERGNKLYVNLKQSQHFLQYFCILLHGSDILLHPHTHTAKYRYHF